MSAMYPIVKRLFDLVIAVPLFILLLPFLTIIGLAVKATSRGPILYLGERVGLGGQKFKIFKFRTMIPNAETQGAGTTTTLDDFRITPFGFFLRKYKLDELPQFWNVIRGDMSLVGPRPEVEEHTSEYHDEEVLILTVRPGITDYSSLTFFNLAEVLGPENPHQVYLTSIRSQKNALRVQYVKNRSFMEDLKIISRTFMTLFLMAFQRKPKNGICKIR